MPHFLLFSSIDSWNRWWFLMTDHVCFLWTCYSKIEESTSELKEWVDCLVCLLVYLSLSLSAGSIFFSFHSSVVDTSFFFFGLFLRGWYYCIREEESGYPALRYLAERLSARRYSVKDTEETDVVQISMMRNDTKFPVRQFFFFGSVVLSCRSAVCLANQPEWERTELMSVMMKIQLIPLYPWGAHFSTSFTHLSDFKRSGAKKVHRSEWERRLRHWITEHHL
jgi:hypothetical protein